MAFGFAHPATFDQTIKVLGAFDYDGIELGGFFDHATLERYPTTQSRKDLAAYVADHGMKVAGVAYEPYGIPWAAGGEEAYKRYLNYFDDFLQEGRIVLVVHPPAVRAMPGAAVAGVAGAFLTAFAQVTGLELANSNVTCNVVVAGWTAESAPANVTSAIPAGRPARDDEIAGAVAYLASAGAGYVTGSILTVDGGFLITKASGGSPLLPAPY